MARFNLEQELVLSKNEQLYKALLLELLNGRSEQELLWDQDALQKLNHAFLTQLQTLPLEIDPHLRRAAARGGYNVILRGDCFAYLGEHDVLLERHDRYFPNSFHSHSFLELLCVVHGHCWHIVNDDLRQLQAGDIICLPPGTRHTFSAYSDDCIIYNLSLRLDKFEARFYKLLQQETILSDFLSKTLYTDQKNTWLLFHSRDYLQGDNLLASIWEIQERGDALTAPILNTLAELLFLELLRICSDRIEVCLGSTETAAIEQKLMAYVQLCFRSVTLAELSEVFRYSERHISRIVLQATGMTLGTFLQQLRLEHIAHLLANTDVSIAAAFDQAGVKNRSYFYKIFRNHFGLTPAQYRAAHSSGTNATD